MDDDLKERIGGLVRELKDKDWSVRWDAADDLREVVKANPGNSEVLTAVPALLGALNDKNLAVREEAADVLGKIGEPALRVMNKLYLEGRISHEVADVFYQSLNEKLTEQGFDKGTVAPPRKKPDDLERKIFRKPPVLQKPGLKRCIAGG